MVFTLAKEYYLPSTGSGECETIIICILSPINTDTNSNDALACHCHHTTPDYGNPPVGKKEGDFRIIDEQKGVIKN